MSVGNKMVTMNTAADARREFPFRVLSPVLPAVQTEPEEGRLPEVSLAQVTR